MSEFSALKGVMKSCMYSVTDLKTDNNHTAYLSLFYNACSKFFNATTSVWEKKLKYLCLKLYYSS